MTLLDELKDSVIKGQLDKVKELTERALKEALSPGEILKEGLIKGMEWIGVEFKNTRIYIPEVLIAARAMKQGLEVLRPLLAKSGVAPVGKLVLGTVKGDLHDIGKNLVGMMMEGAGFEVIDLGIDVPAEKFIETVKSTQSELLGMSALLTTTMVNMKEVIENLDKAGLREKVKVLVGGAPVSQTFADEIGADGYAPNASLAVDKAKELINK
jgi:5-methyltetrahydrofolate--homocysteine methyltransferase